MAACWLRTVSEMFTPLGNELQNIFQTFIWMKLACLSKTYISRWISEASFLSFLYWLSACIPKLSLNTANVGYFPSFKSKHLLVYCKHFLHLTLSWKYWGLFRYFFFPTVLFEFFLLLLFQSSASGWCHFLIGSWTGHRGRGWQRWSRRFGSYGRGWAAMCVSWLHSCTVPGGTGGVWGAERVADQPGPHSHHICLKKKKTWPEFQLTSSSLSFSKTSLHWLAFCETLELEGFLFWLYCKNSASQVHC